MPDNRHRTYLNGAFTHRRTESDYMGALLEVVTLEDWREIVTSAVAAAKRGDTSARTFLAQYLVGRPDLKAPAPVTVVVQQVSGRDPLVEELAKPHLDRLGFPALLTDERAHDAIKGLVAEELRALEAKKIAASKSGASADASRVLPVKPVS